MTKPAVRVEDLTMAYREEPVIWDMDFEIETGTLTAIVGPNGAGKSTLLKGVLGLLKPLSGWAEIFGEPAEKMRRRIGYVPQKSAVNWDFPTTAGDVVLMGRYGSLGWLRRPGAKDRKKAEEALALLEMTDFADRQISEMSGGQKQRIFLARAIAQEADIYFLDEPFQGVDIQTEQIIVRQLHKLRDEGKTIVAVHHDLHTAPKYFDHAILINKTLIAQGTSEEVITADKLQLAYGENFLEVVL